MGAGIAKQIRERWPVVFTEYENFIDYCYNSKLCKQSSDFLGLIQKVLVSDPIVEDGKSFIRTRLIVNFFSQDNYKPRNRCHTNYEAFRKCCKVLVNKLETINPGKSYNIGFPFKIGCGLAGGSWKIISKIIEEEFANHNVEIYDYESLDIANSLI
jgi:hypothetical protein